MAALLAIEPERQPRQWMRKHVESPAQFPPERHEPKVRDVTIGERENKIGPVVGMQPDCRYRPVAALRRSVILFLSSFLIKRAGACHPERARDSARSEGPAFGWPRA